MPKREDVVTEADAGAWPVAPRRRRRGRWLAVIAAAVVVAGLLAYHELTTKLAPIPVGQFPNYSAPLDGTWAGDGVELSFQYPGGIGDFEYSYTGSPLYRRPSWAAPFGYQPENGNWITTNLPGSRDAAIKIWLASPTTEGTLNEHSPSIVLALVGNPAHPTLVCQHPTKGDPCTLSEQG